jgi:hypothetical protein
LIYQRKPGLIVGGTSEVGFYENPGKRSNGREQASDGLKKGILGNDDSGGGFVELTQVLSLPIDCMMGSRPLVGE